MVDPLPFAVCHRPALVHQTWASAQPSGGIRARMIKRQRRNLRQQTRFCGAMGACARLAFTSNGCVKIDVAAAFGSRFRHRWRCPHTSRRQLFGEHAVRGREAQVAWDRAGRTRENPEGVGASCWLPASALRGSLLPAASRSTLGSERRTHARRTNSVLPSVELNEMRVPSVHRRLNRLMQCLKRHAGRHQHLAPALALDRDIRTGGLRLARPQDDLGASPRRGGRGQGRARICAYSPPDNARRRRHGRLRAMGAASPWRGRLGLGLAAKASARRGGYFPPPARYGRSGRRRIYARRTS